MDLMVSSGKQQLKTSIDKCLQTRCLKSDILKRKSVGVWCPVSSVRCLVSGVWCLVSGVRCPVSGVRCPVSGVTIEVLRLYAECNHILGPSLAYVCMLSTTIY
jgi:hypothetical protein